ncbi:hypothetical protein FKM82_021957 [Ascaphus truei]
MGVSVNWGRYRVRLRTFPGVQLWRSRRECKLWAQERIRAQSWELYGRQEVSRSSEAAQLSFSRRAVSAASSGAVIVLEGAAVSMSGGGGSSWQGWRDSWCSRT